jgi:uncharacterized protein
LDRLFLDANVLFSAAYGPSAGVVPLWRVKGASLVTSSFAIQEARRNLRDPEQKARLDGFLGVWIVRPADYLRDKP